MADSLFPPPGGPEPEPAYEAAAVRVQTRERGTPGTAPGGSGGSVGANPAALEAFSTAAEWIDREAVGPVPRVNGLLTDYTERCRWGHLDGGSIVTGTKRWVAENDADRVWARQLAAAFVAAGGHADIATVESLVANLPADQWSTVGSTLMMVVLTKGSADEIRQFFQTNPAALQRFQDSPPPADQVRTWWRGLTPAAQERLTTAAPEAIGNLPGVPYRARDTANRHWLDTELGGAKLALVDISTKKSRPPLFDVTGPEARARIGHMDLATQARLEKLEGLKNALSESRTRGQRFLVQFFPSGDNPKASVASGSLDTATDVAVFTPGINTTVASAPNNVAAAEDVLKTAQKMRDFRHDDSTKMVMVTFLNYDSPNWQGLPIPADEAVRTAAVNGGPRLAAFAHEVKDSVKEPSGTPTRLTMMGHSYGTTVTAEALKSESADQAVLLASPGIYTGWNDRLPNGMGGYMDTEPDATLRVPEGKLFAATSEHDLWASVGLLTSMDGDRFDPATTNPNHRVTRFSAADGHVPAGAERILGGDGRLYAASKHDLRLHEDHPDQYGYTDQGSMTNWNAGATLAGYPEWVVRP